MVLEMNTGLKNDVDNWKMMTVEKNEGGSLLICCVILCRNWKWPQKLLENFQNANEIFGRSCACNIKILLPSRAKTRQAQAFVPFWIIKLKIPYHLYFCTPNAHGWSDQSVMNISKNTSWSASSTQHPTHIPRPNFFIWFSPHKKMCPELIESCLFVVLWMEHSTTTTITATTTVFQEKLSCCCTWHKSSNAVWRGWIYSLTTDLNRLFAGIDSLIYQNWTHMENMYHEVKQMLDDWHLTSSHNCVPSFVLICASFMTDTYTLPYYFVSQSRHSIS